MSTSFSLRNQHQLNVVVVSNLLNDKKRLKLPNGNSEGVL